MSTLIATRGSQCVMAVEFKFNFDDTMLDINGASQDFKTVQTAVFDIAHIPPNAILVGGDVSTDTAFVGPDACNVSIGDSGSATRYLGITDRKAAGRTALVPTGFPTTGAKLRLTLTHTTAVATAGVIAVRAQFIIRDRVNEVATN